MNLDEHDAPILTSYFGLNRRRKAVNDSNKPWRLVVAFRKAAPRE